MILRKRRRNPFAASIHASPSKSKSNEVKENEYAYSRYQRGTIQKYLIRIATFIAFLFSLILIVTSLLSKNDVIDLLKDKPPTFENSTYFESNINHDDSRGSSSTRRIRTESTLHSLRYKCTQQQQDDHNRNSFSFPFKKSLATIVLFQSNGGHQLKNFMAYYAQVIPLRDIVIIDHTNPPHPSDNQQQIESSDPYTQSLLEKYHDLGADIWHCNGDFEHKNEMWSWVTHRYAQNSDFVFPLDIDEYIAILKGDDDGKGEKKKIGEQQLFWNQKDLKHALEKLEHTGKPFKMELGSVYPVDCDEWYSDDASKALKKGITKGRHVEAMDPSLFSASASFLRFEGGPMQKVKFVARRGTKKVHCMDKVFMRGNEFNFTDTGNHYGQTHMHTKEQLRQKCLDTNMTTYQLDQDQKNDLFLMHFQFTNFQEWLMHSLRGASDRGFNRFSWLKKCREKMTSREYCVGWKSLLRTKFDPREMKKLYERQVCNALDSNTYLRYDIQPLFDANTKSGK
jgi:hypothetical protein